jgi:hypothetical protein
MMTNRIMRARPAYQSPPSRRPRSFPRLPAGRGARTPRDVSVPGGPGFLASPGSLARTTVPGFSTGSNAIASATPDGPTGQLLATSTASGGNTVLTFADRSTMTLVGIADITEVSFIR